MYWQTRTRALIGNHGGKWKPCICIQGGGAKGAWEAGVLSVLLEHESTKEPIALFGTSAGAINAMWASTLNPETEPSKLLDKWFSLAMRISAILIYVPALLFSAVVGVLFWFNYPTACAGWAASFLAFCMFSLITALLLHDFFMWGLLTAWSLSIATVGGVLFALGYQWSSAAVFVLVILLFIAMLWLRSSASLLRYIPRRFFNGRRWPGFFRITWLTRLLPRPEGARPLSRIYVYRQCEPQPIAGGMGLEHSGGVPPCAERNRAKSVNVAFRHTD